MPSFNHQLGKSAATLVVIPSPEIIIKITMDKNNNESSKANTY